MPHRLPCLAAAFVLAIVACGVATREVDGQGFGLPDPQDVDVKGVITGFDMRTREMAIGAEQGVFVAALDPVRRSRNGQIVGGVPPVRIEIRAVTTTRVLDDEMLIRTIVKMRDRREVVEPVVEIEVIRALPGEGLRKPGDAEPGVAIPRIDGNAGENGLPPMIGPEQVDAEDADDSAVETLELTGRITSVRAGRVTVAVSVDDATRRIILPTNEDTFVRLVTDDLRRAAVGDAIEAEGVSVEPNRFFATLLAITHVDERLRERGWTDPRELAEAELAEADVAAVEAPTAEEKPQRPAERKPVDPFEVVKREREAKENANRADADPKAEKPKTVYHGRVVRIN